MRNYITLPSLSAALILTTAACLSPLAMAQVMDETPVMEEVPTKLEQFNAADISGDGYLDGDEFAAFQTSMDKSGDDAAFAKHDVNADGLISYEEVQDAHDAMDKEIITEEWEMPADTDMNDMVQDKTEE